MASDTYHEPGELLSDHTKDMHRAIVSLMEELEAIDWYQQRSEATQDLALRAVLEHNRDEETEHAMMVLEWLRRASPKFDANIRTYLLKDGPITELEAAEKEGSNTTSASGRTAGTLAAGGPGGSLGIGSLRASTFAPTSPKRENT